ncbi:unnamed protein product [Linum tenue]|uniref:Uncharacterized protein n=1 Tax=Linum tenue TaxID=586396 RepID=A0AAV0LLD2_9ROSI|nr:unnamed protein product [Linum tenue]
MRALPKAQIIPFSAFWLRSSVVSVLISLISDTWVNGPHDIKLIWVSHVSLMRCTNARAWRTPPISVKFFPIGPYVMGLSIVTLATRSFRPTFWSGSEWIDSPKHISTHYTLIDLFILHLEA